MTEPDIAAAALFEKASAEITGVIAELIAAAKERGEIQDIHSITGHVMMTLLGSAWKLAIFDAGGDRALAAEHYGALLNAHRASVMRAGKAASE